MGEARPAKNKRQHGVAMNAVLLLYSLFLFFRRFIFSDRSAWSALINKYEVLASSLYLFEECKVLCYHLSFIGDMPETRENSTYENIDGLCIAKK
jgi:hypothetical protein